MSKPWTVAAVILPLVLAPSALALADDAPVEVQVTLKNHRWDPAQIHVPAGKRIVIKVKNLDDQAEEFDSDALKVERIIAGNAEGTVRIRPLAAGQYEFEGEYHPDTAKGIVIAE